MKTKDLCVKIYVSDLKTPEQTLSAEIGFTKDNITAYRTQFGDVFPAAETWIENVATLVALEKARQDRITARLNGIVGKLEQREKLEKESDHA